MVYERVKGARCHWEIILAGENAKVRQNTLILESETYIHIIPYINTQNCEDLSQKKMNLELEDRKEEKELLVKSFLGQSFT